MSEYIVNIDVDHASWWNLPIGVHERVVRCKDCAYGKYDDSDLLDATSMLCLRTNSMVKWGNFCAWGERKK